MQTVSRYVRDLDSAHRQALERLFGVSLREDQQIVFSIADIQVQLHRATDPEIPQWWNVYEGLTDEQIDRLDEAVRGRADLTRFVESDDLNTP